MQDFDIVLYPCKIRVIDTVRIIQKTQADSLKKRDKEKYQQNNSRRKQKHIWCKFTVILEHILIMTPRCLMVNMFK